MDRPLSQQFYWDKQQFEYWVQRTLAVIGEHGDKIARSNHALGESNCECTNNMASAIDNGAQIIAEALNNLAEAIRDAGRER